MSLFDTILALKRADCCVLVLCLVLGDVAGLLDDLLQPPGHGLVQGPGQPEGKAAAGPVREISCSWIISHPIKPQFSESLNKEHMELRKKMRALSLRGPEILIDFNLDQGRPEGKTVDQAASFSKFK